jgi:hypothetical protein
MATSTIQTNNKLIKFTQQINREWVRENMFSPYMGEDINSIIRRRMELKSGGEVMNIPLVRRLVGAGVSTGPLVGAEEAIEDYGYRIWLEWARNAVTTTKAEQQKDSADIFGEAKPLLTDWIMELTRDEIIQAFMALPSESQPAAGTRVNGILYDLATATQRGQWQADNADRVLYGAALSNRVASAVATDHAASLANVDGTADKCTAASLSLLKRVAMGANPRIRPYRTKDGYEYYVAFMGLNPFRDLKLDLAVVNKDARPRENMGTYGAPNNPLFQDGDQLYDGVIVRLVPEISGFVTSKWTTLLTAGAAGTPAGYTGRVEPVFLCGQQAMSIAYGQMAKPTFRKEDDYGFITGTGIEAAYGVGKMFAKVPKAGTALKQWGVVTGFFASSSD